MSERKHTFHYLVFTETELYGDVYSKNDVDNVIAERDKVIEEQDNEIARQKRKRCLALAKIASDNWHLHNSFYAMGKMDFEQKKCERYERHRLKWLAIADKFNEA